MKFLVVDDSVEDVALLRTALEPVGPVEITPIQSGHTAMQLLSSSQTWPFDLIVIDWRLPGITGDQLAKAFLTSPDIPAEVPLVVLSSVLPKLISEELHQSGALVLEKPVDLEGYDRLALGLCHLALRSKARTTLTPSHAVVSS